jgi:hypothetical protein
MSLTAFEATRYATIARKEIERAKDRTEDTFSDACDNMRDEARACFNADEDGDPDEYLEEVLAVLENEWNDDSNWPTPVAA